MKKAYLIFNPACSKCRGADEILREKGIDFEPVLYLQGGLTRELVERLPRLLNLSYEEMMRTKEDLYQSLRISEKKLTKDEWIELILTNPIILERPIFIYGDKAIIARPSEMVNQLL